MGASAQRICHSYYRCDAVYEWHTGPGELLQLNLLCRLSTRAATYGGEKLKFNLPSLAEDAYATEADFPRSFAKKNFLRVYRATGRSNSFSPHLRVVVRVNSHLKWIMTD